MWGVGAWGGAAEPPACTLPGHSEACHAPRVSRPAVGAPLQKGRATSWRAVCEAHSMCVPCAVFECAVRRAGCIRHGLYTISFLRLA